MAPSPLRKRLTNEDKMKIIEESKQPGFFFHEHICTNFVLLFHELIECVFFSFQTLHHMFSNYMDSFFLNTYMYFGEKLASQITFECLFLQMKGKVPYILQNNGDLMINAEFLFNLILHMMFRDKFVIVDYL